MLKFIQKVRADVSLQNNHSVRDVRPEAVTDER